MASKSRNDQDAAPTTAEGEVRPADVKRTRATLRKVETQLRFRQWELDHLEEKVRAADVHLNRLKRMAGDYPSATWENERLNHDAEKALRALLVFAQSLQRGRSGMYSHARHVGGYEVTRQSRRRCLECLPSSRDKFRDARIG